MIGDCQCLVGNTFYDNPKPYEQIVAERRAQIIADSPLPHDHFLSDDVARKAVIPLMLEYMQEQNKTYSVIDGFPIPEKYVKVISLDFQPWEIVLASDGYPFLCNTLDESEQKLAHQKSNDPLNIGDFKATKGFMQGYNSFDDRAYIRFQV
jgi:glycerophosphoryl diester phosphodiesterase